MAPTLSSVFLIDIFCALTKLPTVTWIARSMSSARTYSRRFIFADASAMRIMLSRCRTVMGNEPVARDSRRRSAYSRASLSWSSWCSFGRICSLAYMMYFRSMSWGMIWDISTARLRVDHYSHPRPRSSTHSPRPLPSQIAGDFGDDFRRQTGRASRPAPGPPRP